MLKVFGNLLIFFVVLQFLLCEGKKGRKYKKGSTVRKEYTVHGHDPSFIRKLDLPNPYQLDLPFTNYTYKNMTYDVKEIRNRRTNKLLKLVYKDINIKVEGYYKPDYTNATIKLGIFFKASKIWINLTKIKSRISNTTASCDIIDGKNVVDEETKLKILKAQKIGWFSKYYKAFYNASLRKARVEKKIRMKGEQEKNKNRIVKNY